MNDTIYRREDRPVYTPYSVDPVTEVETPESLTPRKGGSASDAEGVGYAQAWYQLSDPQLSVVSVVAVHDAVTNAVGSVIDELEYDPYGNVRRTPGYGCLNASSVGEAGNAGGASGIDVDHSGVVDINDLFAGVQDGYFTASPAADFNQDGETGVSDLFLGMDTWFVANGTPAYQRSRLCASYVPGVKNGSGTITSYGTVQLGESASDNPYGYCGYYFDVETAAAKVLGPDARDSAYGTGGLLDANGNPVIAEGGAWGGMSDWGGALYSVRHRVYDPQQGRWLTRDPAGFVDGMNLYEYCGGRATSCFDPMGLMCDPKWHHGTPQNLLRGKDPWIDKLGRENFDLDGFDIDAMDNGRIFESGDHSYNTVHREYNSDFYNDLEKLVNEYKQSGKKLLRPTSSEYAMHLKVVRSTSRGSPRRCRQNIRTAPGFASCPRRSVRHGWLKSQNRPKPSLPRNLRLYGSPALPRRQVRL